MHGADRTARRAARWLRSGLMDAEFYAALRGRPFDSPTEAAEDFVVHGMPHRLTSHPFLDFVSLPPDVRRAWRAGKVAPVLAHLTGADGRIRPMGPLTEIADPASARADLLGLARRLGREAAGGANPTPTSVDWRAAEQTRRRADLTSVIVVAAEPRRTIRTVDHLLKRSDGHELEVVVVDGGSAAPVALGLLASLRGRPGVELLRLPKPVSAVTAANRAIAGVSGEVVILLDPHVAVRRGWLPAVLEALDDPEVAGVQPLLLRADDTIASAGVRTGEGRSPVRLLAGHPKEDARRLEGQRLVAIAGEAMALRTADLVALEGLRLRPSWADSALDLCQRLVERRPGGFRIAATALVTLRKADPDPEPMARPAVLTPTPELDERIALRRDARRGQLRWSLKLPSEPGPSGDLWGDTHFADALATALRDLGQDVVTRRRGAHTAGPTHLDDVSLALRGLFPIPPTPGQVNVLWVISHPDDLDPRELEGYDLVFAASRPWSQELSARTGREVIPLLQATEFQPPTCAPGEGQRGASVVFVGNANAGRERPLVWKAVDAGVDVAVYGRGWKDLPAGIWRGEYVDNARLPALYHEHGIVLADHWPDMARHGFIANRVFDALSSGARVISDDVVGIHDVFDPTEVVVATTPAEVAAAVAQLSRSAPVERPARAGLSFHDRARTLLDLVSRR